MSTMDNFKIFYKIPKQFRKTIMSFHVNQNFNNSNNYYKVLFVKYDKYETQVYSMNSKIISYLVCNKLDASYPTEIPELRGKEITEFIVAGESNFAITKDKDGKHISMGR